MFQRFAKFLEVREATEEEVEEAFQHDASNNHSSGADDPEPEELLINDTALVNGLHEDALQEVQPNPASPTLNGKSVSQSFQQRRLSEQSEDGGFIQKRPARRSSDTLPMSPPIVMSVSTANNMPPKEILPEYMLGQQTPTHEDNEDRLYEVSLDSQPDTALVTPQHADPSVSSQQMLVPTVKKEYGVKEENEPRVTFIRAAEVPSKLIHDSKTSNTITKHILDESLATKLMLEDACLTDEYDEQIRQWARSGDTSSDKEKVDHNEIRPSAPSAGVKPTIDRFPPNADNSLAFDRIDLVQQEVQQKSERIFFLETELAIAERSRTDVENRLSRVSTESEARIIELETQVKSLRDKLLMAETKLLTVNVLGSKRNTVRSTDPPANMDDLLKHCTRLVRRLGQDEDAHERLTRELEQTKLAGQQIAALSAKVLACEQQVKDEKLVLKNLFLSWMERGERKDAFEILARAFEFTPEDRRRMEAKNALARGASLGVKWSLSESIADFVRDETS